MLLFEWTKSKEDIKVRHRPGGVSKEVDYLGRPFRNKAYELMREYAQSSPILLCCSSIGHSLLLFVMSPFGHQMDMILAESRLNSLAELD